MTLHSVVSVKSLVSSFIEVFFFLSPYIFVFKIYSVYVLVKVLLNKCIQLQNILRETQHSTPLQSIQGNVAQAAEKNIKSNFSVGKWTRTIEQQSILEI